MSHETTGDAAHKKGHADSAKAHAAEQKAVEKTLADNEKVLAAQAERVLCAECNVGRHEVCQKTDEVPCDCTHGDVS